MARNVKWTIYVSLMLIPFMCFAASDIDRKTANNGNLILEDIPEIPQSIIDDLNRYQNTRSADFEAWARNSQSLYITTRFGDVSQIHRIDTPGGARHQLTFFKEPIGAVTRQKTGDLIAFTMDVGGSENAQIFIFDSANGESRLISDGESRNGSLLWSPQGDQLAYHSTRRNGASNDIWITPIDKPDKAKLVWAAPDGSSWTPADWSEEELFLLVQQYVSVSDSRIHLLNLKTGKSTALRGSEKEPSLNRAIGFNYQDNGFFFLSDAESEFAQLFFSKLDGTEKKVLTADIQWDIQSVRLSVDGKRGAFVVNEGGVNRLYLFDPKSFKYQEVSGLPIGLIGGFEFSPDNKHLALTMNTAKTPSDTFVLSLKSSAIKHGRLQRWTYSEIGGLNTDSFVEPQLIKYPTFDQVNGKARQIPAYLYKPRSKGPHPVVLMIHGGPEGQYRPGFNSAIQFWASKLGIAVIAPNVRGSTGYGREYVRLDNGLKREDSVKDIGALLDWIKTQSDLDAERVAVYGGSYGGYMVLASAVHYSDRLTAAIDVVGISNFVSFLQNTKDYRRDLRRVEYGDERDPEMRAFLEKISPNNNVDKIIIPMLIVQGQNDPRVPVTESAQMVHALRGKGRSVWYMNALNEGHGYIKKENRDVYQQIVSLFLQKYLIAN